MELTRAVGDHYSEGQLATIADGINLAIAQSGNNDQVAPSIRFALIHMLVLGYVTKDNGRILLDQAPVLFGRFAQHMVESGRWSRMPGRSELLDMLPFMARDFLDAFAGIDNDSG